MTAKKTLTEHKQRQQDKQVELEQREYCTATAWHDGKVRMCNRTRGHDGNHKRGSYEWRPRSGDPR